MTSDDRAHDGQPHRSGCRQGRATGTFQRRSSQPTGVLHRRPGSLVCQGVSNVPGQESEERPDAVYIYRRTHSDDGGNAGPGASNQPPRD